MEEARKIFEKHVEHRKAVLLKIYELSKAITDKDVEYKTPFEKIINLTESSDAVKNYLVNEGLIKITNEEYKTIRITHDGIKAVELLLRGETPSVMTVVKNRFWLL